MNDDLIPGVRHVDAPAPGEPVVSHYHLCFGCGVDHPTGLHMKITAGEGLTVTAEFVVGANHQGAPGLAHGGMLTTAFDETLSAINWLLRKSAVTVQLHTEFRRPVPVDSRVFIHAQCTGIAGRKIFTEAIGRLNGPDGPIAVKANAIFVEVPLEHFFSYGRAEDLEHAATRDEVQERTKGLSVNP
ncbi:unannotated protein [freshwater metagenome]|uniref:Acyl-coenzyme A thioesterase THEM4 n=1 Tax=freshwater metagenome TaxID=449393 RepID=A0A6J7CUM5_9ZZZZ|nr:PaaI family thioesterase [Actinomycetota bacterium]